jgi:hypothetical protein
MSDTPETDANKYPADTFCGSGSKTPVVHVDFARRLERKLNEALAKVESIHQDRLKVLVERDQWRECAEGFYEIADRVELHMAKDLVSKFERLKGVTK